MKPVLFGEEIRSGRLAAWLAVILAASIAAVVFLPSGLVRLVVLGILALPLFLAIFDRPQWIFYALVFLIFSNVYIFFSFRIYRVLLLLLAVSLAVSIVRGRRFVIHDRPFFALAAAFSIIIFQSVAFARNIDASLSGLSKFTKILVTMLLMVQFSRDRSEFFRIVIFICAAIFVSDFFPLIIPPPERYKDMSLIWQQGVLRYEGYFLEANFFAFYQVFFIPLLLYLFARFKKPWFVRPLLTAVIAGAVFVTFLSFSRGGFVGLASLFVILFVVERKNRALLWGGIAVVALVAVMAPAVYWDRIATIFNTQTEWSQDLAIVSRFETMKTAVRLGFSNPIFGVGIDNFLEQAARFVPFNLDVHNAILQVLAETGLLGLSVIVTIVLYNFRVINRLMKRTDDPEAAQLGRILFVQQGAVFVNAMFLPAAYQPVLWFCFLFPTLARYAYRHRPAA